MLLSECSSRPNTRWVTLDNHSEQCSKCNHSPMKPNKIKSAQASNVSTQSKMKKSTIGSETRKWIPKENLNHQIKLTISIGHLMTWETKCKMTMRTRKPKKSSELYYMKKS